MNIQRSHLKTFEQLVLVRSPKRPQQQIVNRGSMTEIETSKPDSMLEFGVFNPYQAPMK